MKHPRVTEIIEFGADVAKGAGYACFIGHFLVEKFGLDKVVMRREFAEFGRLESWL